jgi:radial spoke head protein 9
LKINEEGLYEQVLFWGKIEGNTSRLFEEYIGSDKDYYVALCLNYKGCYEFPQKKFFWSGEDFKFSPLPLCNPEHKDRVDAVLTPFTGDPTLKLYEVPAGTARSFSYFYRGLS